MIPLWSNTIQGKLTACAPSFWHTQGISSNQLTGSQSGFTCKELISVLAFSTENHEIKQVDKTHTRQYSNV